ncbi:allantoate amidohydrolase [Effusibacillus consociatus]|uniref:Allantoate amidohydrolase n=1 Tax=Effusibacillus consociatus TaxID=1117041 RepID=A0ABV9PYN8_9BACL
MNTLHQKINVERIMQRIDKLAECSSTDYGVTRLSFTKESEAAAELVSQWMRDAGMSVRRDQLNNLIGRYEGKHSDAPVLIIGSHLDSVVHAGKYDGILGVISGIEVVQTLFENGVQPDTPIEVVAFCDEEGARFHTTLLGSRAMAGSLRDEDFEAEDEKGTTLASSIRELGLDPSAYRLAARDPKTIKGYIELHIEQGPVLEQLDQACGVVVGIAGASRYEFRVEGSAGHAGTVPMALRKDALVGASEMIQAIERITLQYENVVATVGKLTVTPGASNVIPGTVKGTLDIRSIEDEQRHEALKLIVEECERISQRQGLSCYFYKIMESSAVSCSNSFMNVISTVLEMHDIIPFEIVSGAGHDAMAMAAIAEIGMIFVRCKEGISHHPAEEVTGEDMQKAASVLLDTVVKLTASID